MTVTGAVDRRRTVNKRGGGAAGGLAASLGYLVKEHTRAVAFAAASAVLVAGGGFVWADRDSGGGGAASIANLPAVPSAAYTAAAGATGLGSGLRAVVCSDPNASRTWSLWDLTGASERQVAQYPSGTSGSYAPETGGRVAPANPCYRYTDFERGAGIVGDNVSWVAGLFQVSPNQKRAAAAWYPSYGASDSTAFAGYIGNGTDLSSLPSGQSVPAGFTSVSGSTAQADSNVAFDPATGDLWWQNAKSGDAFSSTIPPSTPVDHGSGFAYAFTGSGQPMPVPFYDSPDGSRRLLFLYLDPTKTTSGKHLDLIVGPTKSLSSSCVEKAFSAYGTNLPTGICGSTTVETTADQCDQPVGWVNGTTLACITGAGWGTGDIEYSQGLGLLTISASGQLGAAKPIGLSDSYIADALVTPDGKQILCVVLTDIAGQEEQLELLPAADGGGGPAGGTVLAQPVQTNDHILGFLLPDGEPVI